jgi:hypothetical protein
VSWGSYTVSNIESSILAGCPGNGYKIVSYDIPQDSKIVGFKYTDYYFDASHNHLLLDFEPLFVKLD